MAFTRVTIPGSRRTLFVSEVDEVRRSARVSSPLLRPCRRRPDLEPILRPPRDIGRIEPLADDSLKLEIGDRAEQRRAVVPEDESPGGIARFLAGLGVPGHYSRTVLRALF